MPQTPQPAELWLARELEALKGAVAGLKAQQTQFVIDSESIARAVIGNLTMDQNGNSTGLTGFGIATWNGTAWRKLSTEAWKGAEALGFEHSWKNLEAGRKAEYRKDVFGNVELRGVLASGVAGESAFTLPVGYRPKEDKGLVGSAAAGVAEIKVLATGAVTPANTFGAKTETFVWLDQVRFSTE
jgi:hypothetical protein